MQAFIMRILVRVGLGRSGGLGLLLPQEGGSTSGEASRNAGAGIDSGRPKSIYIYIYMYIFYIYLNLFIYLFILVYVD